MWKHCVIALSVIFVFNACNANSSKNQFDLAERLFKEKKYSASIYEFRKIVKKNPKSKLGIDALYRVGVIQRLYLSEPEKAIESFQALLIRTEDPDFLRKIRETIAEMYFSDFNDFDRAIPFYAALAKDSSPKNLKRDFYLYRHGRALFLMGRFEAASKSFAEIEKNFPNSSYREKASLARADAFNSQGNCEDAIEVYELLSASKESKIKNMAIFGMANCYEEIDNLDKAYDLLASIRDTYTTPHVIDLKMKKIKRRKIRRRR